LKQQYKDRKYIYFPSFSVGNVAAAMHRKETWNDPEKSTMRFYDANYPDGYRHPYYLITGGHYYKKPTISQEMGLLEPGVLTIGDSGGFQIASGAVKYVGEKKKMLRETMFSWLEGNSHIAMNLDIPPRMQWEGKFQEALDESLINFKYFDENQSGSTKFLNVLQGSEYSSYAEWYRQVKDFGFNGWGIGGAGKISNIMVSLAVLFENKEQLMDRNHYLHFLGASKITDFFVFSQMQKSLNEIGSPMQVTTDSSSPSRSILYGTCYVAADWKKLNFKVVHIPKITGKSVKNDKGIHTTSNLQPGEFFKLPKTTKFDDTLERLYTGKDMAEWTIQGWAAIQAHNLFVFKDAMDQVENFMDLHPYILEQVTGPDLYKLMMVIDQMVKAPLNGDSAKSIYEDNLKLFTKLDNVGEEFKLKEHNFFG